MFSTLIGSQPSSQTLSKNEIEPKECYGNCLVVCCNCLVIHYSFLSSSEASNDVLSTNRRHTSEIAVYVPDIGQQQRANSSLRQWSPTRSTTDSVEARRTGVQKSTSSAIFTKYFANWVSLFQTFRQLSTREMR